MKKYIVLLRHGQSLWNLENRFTGWTDVDLTDLGRYEAHRAGKLLQQEGFWFDYAFTSMLTRAIKTLNLTLDTLNQNWLPVCKHWRLNEKHYGALQGLNKEDTAKRYGDEQVNLWRRGYDYPPPALSVSDSRASQNDPRYARIPNAYIPLTESLKDTIHRTLPLWEESIFPLLTVKQQLLVVAHGNSLRGIVKKLKNISDEDIIRLNIPTGVPYVFEFNDMLQLERDYFLGNNG